MALPAKQDAISDTDLRAELLQITQSDFRVLQFISQICFDGIWYWSATAPDEAWISPRFWKTLGYRRDDALGAQELWRQILFLEDRKCLDASVAAHLDRPEEPFDQILRYHHKDGTTAWMRLRGIVLHNDENTEPRLLGVHMDVTPLKRMQGELEAKTRALEGAAAELRRREEELHFIFDNLPVRIWYKDDRNRILRLNEPAARALGTTVAEAEGRNAYDLCPAILKGWNDKDLATIHLGDERSEIRCRNSWLDSDERWVRTDRIPHFDRSLGLRTVLVVETDVSEQKEKEEELRLLNAQLERQRQHYRDLYRHTPAMMHTIDEDGYLIEVSDRWLNALGYKREEVVGHKAIEFLTASSRRQYVENVLPAFWRDGGYTDIPFQVLRKDGTVMEVDISGVLDRDPVTGGWCGLAITTDVSDQNAALVEAETKNIELDKQNRSLECFAAAASRDFQEPLRKIEALGGFLLDDHGEQLNAAARAHIDTMNGEVQRMSQMINDLLAYLRMRTRKPSNQKIDLTKLIDKLANDLAARLEEIGGRMTRESGPMVLGDSVMIESLFKNVIDNAVRFRHPERPLTLEIGFRREPATEELLCTFKDNAVGFDPEQAWKLFEPFTRLHASETATGSGMGLAICRTICEKHGWSIWADPADDEGAVFTIRIPRHAVREPDAG